MEVYVRLTVRKGKPTPNSLIYGSVPTFLVLETFGDLWMKLATTARDFWFLLFKSHDSE